MFSHSGGFCGPRLDIHRSFGIKHLVMDCMRNQDATVQRLKDIDSINEDEVVERRGVCERRSFRVCRLRRSNGGQLVRGGDVLLEMFRGVVKIDIVFGQQCMDFHARLITEQTANLGLGQVL